MFGFGRRRDGESKRLAAREKELVAQLEQVTHELEDEKRRCSENGSRVAFLASQNRALAAKVHRLAMSRLALQCGHDRLEKEQERLRLENLSLQSQAQVAVGERADYAQVEQLKGQLKEQAARYEGKLDSLKRRTKALLASVLPPSTSAPAKALPGAGETGGGSGAPTRRLEGSGTAPASAAAAGPSLDRLAPTPGSGELPPMDPETQRQVRVLQIVACLYDDSIDEGAALEQLGAILLEGSLLGGHAHGEGQQQQQARSGSGRKADASTATSPAAPPRARHVTDAATETPAEMSSSGTPYLVASTPLEPGGSPRAGAESGSRGVPAIDLAALLTHTMNSAASEAPGAGTSANAAAMFSFSSFVLAEPEKLQRLILRTRQQQAMAAAGAGGGAPTGPSAPQLGRTSVGAGGGHPALRELPLPQHAPGEGGSGGSFSSRIAGGFLGLSLTGAAHNAAVPAWPAAAASSSAAPAASTNITGAVTSSPVKAPPAASKTPKKGPVPAGTGNASANAPKFVVLGQQQQPTAAGAQHKATGTGPLLTGLRFGGGGGGVTGAAGAAAPHQHKQLPALEEDLRCFGGGGSGGSPEPFSSSRAMVRGRGQ